MRYNFVKDDVYILKYILAMSATSKAVEQYRMPSQERGETWRKFDKRV